jgi:hypothetical protein
VAVGATDDETGSTLYERSSTGAPGGRGPFVCASKWSIHDDPDPGTSFAAARVSRELAILTAFLLTLRRALQPDDDPEGLPLVALGFVDEGPLAHTDTRLENAAYPLGLGIDPEAARDLVTPGFEVDGGIALKALAHSARPIPDDHGPHEVGYGFVSAETTRAYLERFDASELGRLLDLDVPPGRADTRLTTDEIERAIDVWAYGALWVYWDFQAGSGTEA